MIKHIIHSVKPLALPLLIAGLSLAAFSLTTAMAQEKPRNSKKPNGLEKNTDNSRASEWALETGEIAGGATFCALDAEDIETFILRAQAQIASEAHSDVDLVIARITFNNTLDTASVKAPEGGCEGFGEVFTRELARLE